MKLKKEDMLLYAVTDRRWLKDGETIADQVEKALKGGVTFVQLREKGRTTEEIIKEAVPIRELCRKYGVPFVIDDDIEAAIRVDADGVHVGQEDMEAGRVRELLGPDKIIGVSAHNVEEAKRAVECGADYLGSGAVFPTTTHKTVKQLPIDTLKNITEAVDIPVVAIGGINGSNMGMLKGTGIDGVAVVTAIFGQEDIEEAARMLKDMIVKEVGNGRKAEGHDS